MANKYTASQAPSGLSELYASGMTQTEPKRCDVCSTEEANKHYDWANLTGKYHDVTDYKRMCRSCHWKYDGKINNITGGRS